MGKDIFISIVVPIYNVENELKRCIDSLISQSFPDIEIILVDDGSTDGSPMICDDYGKKYSRIKIIHKKNGGLSDARNIGLRRAVGEYVLYVDSDDYIERDSCERFVQALNGRMADIVVGEARELTGHAVSFQRHSNLEAGREYSAKEYIELAVRKKEWYAPSWLNLYRRKFLLDNKLFFKENLLHEDVEILPRLFLRAKTVIYMKYSFYNYIIRQGSINQMADADRSLRDLWLIYEEWTRISDGIQDKRLRRAVRGFLSRLFIASCRRFHVERERNPEGINSLFLLKNNIDSIEFLKTVCFLLFRKFYVNH